MEDLYRPRTSGRAPVVLGCMNFGKRTCEADARRIIDLAYERGVRHFDIANAYVEGVSERIVGQALVARRGEVHIATKVGWWRKEGLGPERIKASIDESLARIGTDYVDLYYFHVPDPATPIEASVEAIGEVLASGKAKAFGLSNYASWQALEVIVACDRLGVPRPVVSQQLYNLLIRQLDLEYFRFAKKYALHTTVYNPLAGGLLTARGIVDPKSGARFERNPMYQRRYLSDTFLEVARAYAGIAASLPEGIVTLAYAWLAQRAGVDSIIVGPGSLPHLEAALSSLDVVLDEAMLKEIDAIHYTLAGTDVSYAR